MESKSWIKHYDQGVPETIRYPKITLTDLLQIPASTCPDKAATILYGTKMTFWELRENSIRLANALAGLGVKKGDRVGIHLPNTPQYVIAYYATLYLGGIVVNLSPLYTSDELEKMLNKTGMTTLITFDMVIENVRPIVLKTPLSSVVVTKVTDFMDGLEKSTPEKLGLNDNWYHFSQLIDNSLNTKLPRVQLSPDDPALIQFTGGTTGIPKGAVLTHANIVAGAYQVMTWSTYIDKIIPAEQHSTLAIIPYFHVFGNVVGLNRGMLACTSQILVPRFDVDELMNILENHDNITFFPAVPTMINAIINHPKSKTMPLGKKFCVLSSGGAPMPVELIEQLNDLGIFFTEGYGLSETCSLATVTPVIGMKKPGSIGIPLPDMDIKLVDIETGENEVRQGDPGEIVVKGPVVMQEYWNDPKETAAQLRDGWLYTGDIAIRDEDDYFFIVDRKKDMIIAGGYNIYPREIDEVLFTHPKILEAIAVGIPDDYRGETVKAYVVLKEGKTASEKEIIDFCKEKLAVYKTPKLVEFRDSLPKSAVGKILRKILRDEEAAKDVRKANLSDMKKDE
ncbi:MAG: long-chain fatty acid--CoA ligase [Deltaproteobacteria bacterium]|nr:long-chain fatty acid--CoA ligase [Deltaproteobacteria bacterium]